MCTTSGGVGLSQQLVLLIRPPAKPDIHLVVSVQQEDSCALRRGEGGGERGEGRGERGGGRGERGEGRGERRGEGGEGRGERGGGRGGC